MAAVHHRVFLATTFFSFPGPDRPSLSTIVYLLFQYIAYKKVTPPFPRLFFLDTVFEHIKIQQPYPSASGGFPEHCGAGRTLYFARYRREARSRCCTPKSLQNPEILICRRAWQKWWGRPSGKHTKTNIKTRKFGRYDIRASCKAIR